MNALVPQARKWMALAVMVATALVATVAFGEDLSPCYEAYGMSGLSQLMTFEEFSQLHCDGLCFSESDQQEIQVHRDTSRTHGD